MKNICSPGDRGPSRPRITLANKTKHEEDTIVLNSPIFLPKFSYILQRSKVTAAENQLVESRYLNLIWINSYTSTEKNLRGLRRKGAMEFFSVHSINWSTLWKLRRLLEESDSLRPSSSTNLRKNLIGKAVLRWILLAISTKNTICGIAEPASNHAKIKVLIKLRRRIGSSFGVK